MLPLISVLGTSMGDEQPFALFKKGCGRTRKMELMNNRTTVLLRYKYQYRILLKLDIQISLYIRVLQ